MKTKHTPAPWKVLNFNDTFGYTTITNEDESIIIADTMYFEGSSIFDLEEAEANAKLIAAAPDLLEACKLFIENGFQTPSNKDFNILVEAVKKATE